MNGPREPRSRLYDGAFFAWFLDPILRGLHRHVAELVPDGVTVLDAACGTGDLLFLLAPRVREGLGVELSPAHVRWAERERARRGLDQLRFEVGDAGRLDLPDGAFDVATIVLAVHEMPPEARAPVLAELGRVARRVLIVDWATPMPRNFAGMRNRSLELGAGPEHFRHYLDFQRRGGLDPLLVEAGLGIEAQHAVDQRTIRVVSAKLPG